MSQDARTTASTRRQLIDRYGADTARLFVMFASPPEQTLEWNDAGVEGAHRFLRRVWSFGVKHAAALRAAGDGAAGLDGRGSAAKALRREVHACCARSATTTSACSTTPSSPAR